MLFYQCKYKTTGIYKYQHNPEISELGLKTNFMKYDYGLPSRSSTSENLNIIDFNLYDGIGPISLQ